MTPASERGKGFVYRAANGKLLRSAVELERIRKLALPPAWRDVWICQTRAGCPARCLRAAERNAAGSAPRSAI